MLIKEFVKLSLNEKKMSEKDAEESSLALLIHSDSYETEFVLYDVKGMYDFAMKFNAHNDMTIAKNAIGFIKGMIVTIKSHYGHAPAYNASAVALSAAEKGYGPLMYDIAMKHCGKLISDRDEVSPLAKSVWNHYKNNRNDVESYKLDNFYDPKTATKFDDSYVFDDGDDENPLNYAYELKSSLNIEKLISNNEELLERFPVSRKVIRIASRRFFQRMHQQ